MLPVGKDQEESWTSLGEKHRIRSHIEGITRKEFLTVDEKLQTC